MNQEIQETIAKLVNFLETISIQNPSLTLNYSQIAHFPMLVNSPSLFLTCLNEAASQIANYPVNVRLVHLNKFTSLKVLKASSVSTLVQIRGTVVRVSSIVPFVLQMSFICSTCHNPTLVVLENGLFKTPAKCATFKCKSKSFTPSRGTEHDTKTTDYQKIRIQEKLADDQVDSIFY